MKFPHFKFPLITLICLICLVRLSAQEAAGLDYYLPANLDYNPAIPTPESVIGHQVGEWHVTHDKLVYYMKALAAASDRIEIEERGTTYEGRPLLLLKVTSPANHGRLEELRRQHIALSGPGSGSADLESMPIVVYQGFSIHGNEPSGANAGLAYAYYLAAAQGPEIDAMLRQTIILMDPSFNPDGLQRFAHWANSNRSLNLNPDPNDREYDETWPGGRTNHYWFDLNRDWLPVQLPESQARIRTFHDWKPNIVTDHHEMGTNSTFFFQPGEPSRVHPLTPKRNFELTAEIGAYHAKALNQIGSLYYSEEDYDDYYYGKGSTFPDVNGAIGILFEQASSRGHIQESDNGLLSFPFTVRNQFVTALSTIEAATAMRTKLLAFQRDFYSEMRTAKPGFRGYVFGDAKDAGRARHLAEILLRHNLDVRPLSGEQSIGGKTYKEGYSYVVPMAQHNPSLLQAMFEKRTTFTDSLFYDISAWTFPLAFGLDYNEVSSLPASGESLVELPAPGGGVDRMSNYAYLFEWHEYYTPKLLYALLDKGIRAKVAREPFTLEGKDYDYGTIMIPARNQDMEPDDIYALLREASAGSGIEVFGVQTGQTRGIDLGSREFEVVPAPKVALLVGDGIRSYDAGEIWHLFDTRYQMPITKLETADVARADLSRYTDIIIPSTWGSGGLGDEAAEALKAWVRDGGTLIGYRSVANWFDSKEFMKLEFRQDTTLRATDLRFDQKEAYLGAQVTGGAIFETVLDRSHPVNWGYSSDRLPLFRNSNTYLEPEKSSFDNPIRYTESPLLSGYISEENARLISESVPFKARRMGQGRVILFTDNTNFRAFWYGTNKLLMNAIFFGHVM